MKDPLPTAVDPLFKRADSAAQPDFLLQVEADRAYRALAEFERFALTLGVLSQEEAETLRTTCNLARRFSL